MNTLGISTGGFHLYAQAYAAAYAMRRIKFDRIIGGSSGAAIALVAAVHGPERVVEIIEKVDLRRAYSYIPFNNNGKIKPWSIVRFLTGRSLAVQDNRGILSDLVSDEDFEAYQANSDAPTAYVVTVEMNTGKRMLWNLKTCTYEEGMFAAWCSTLMQGISKGLYAPAHFPKLYHGYHVDAGQLDHVQTPLILNSKTENLVSIYSRPRIWKLPKQQMHPRSGGWKEHFRMIAIDNREKFDNDIEKESRLCEKYNIKRYQIFMDRLKHSFDTNEERQKKTINSALKSAQEALGHLKPI